MTAPAGAITIPDLPHDDTAERSVIGSVFIKPSAWYEVSDIQTDDFMAPAHREIWDAMAALVKRGGAHGDPIAVADELRTAGVLSKLNGGLMYLMDTMNAVPTAENVRHYADIVRGRAVQRRLIAVCAEVMSQAKGEWSNVSELLSEARSKFAAIETSGMSATRVIGADYDRVVARMEKRGVAAADPKGLVITTGLTKLDVMLGPLRADNVIVVGANPGRGKSAWALGVAIHNAMKAGIPALVFSMEMSRDQLIERAIAREERINGRNVTAGRMSRDQWYRVAVSRLRDIPLYINDERMTVGRLQGEVRSWRAKMRRDRLAKGYSAEDAELAVVVVDYLQLMDLDSGDNRKRYEAVGVASRELKMLSKERDANLPIIELVQLNRANVKEVGKDGKPREPQISDIRESGNIEQDADIILFPWWDSDPKPFGRHPAVMLVRKQRSGVPGRVPVDWEPEYLTFTDRIEADDPRLPPEHDVEPERDTR